MLLDIFKKNYSRFSLIAIEQESSLAECCRTAFTWSDIPNSLCLAMDKRYFLSAINNNNIKGIIAPPSAVSPDLMREKGVVVCSRADELFYYIHNLGIHNSCQQTHLIKPYIHESAEIATSAIVDKNVVIEENVKIYDNCIVRNESILGKNSVLYENVTIGSDGFFSKTIESNKVHVQHFGGVRVGCNCIIHAGTNISKSVNHGEYTTLGNNVHIGINSNVGHDCRIGENSDISAKVMLSGRVRIGKNCWIGASVTVSNAVSIGDEANVKIGSVVIDDVKGGEVVSGNFALSHTNNLKKFLKMKRIV